jgi:hypothetical protein
MLTSGNGKYKIWLKKQSIGQDLIFFLGGGVKPHIGGIVICYPNKKPKIIKFEGHYDHIILKPIAEVACKKYKTKVLVVGGVHIDNASKKEIKLLINNCKTLVDLI